jgi:hypothetical protein
MRSSIGDNGYELVNAEWVCNRFWLFSRNRLPWSEHTTNPRPQGQAQRNTSRRDRLKFTSIPATEPAAVAITG